MGCCFYEWMRGRFIKECLEDNCWIMVRVVRCIDVLWWLIEWDTRCYIRFTARR